MSPAISTPIGDVPAIVFLVAILGVAALGTAIALPHYRKMRLRRRIRNLPPPPIKREVEPELKLPRRGGASEPEP